MNLVEGMRAFQGVASAGSFSGAAKSLHVSTAWVSTLIAQLERHLGVQLLVRTTRRVTLTDVGRSYLEHCVRILEDLDEAERAVGRQRTTPRGKLRVSGPLSFGLARLAALIPDFSRQYPEVEVDLQLSDAYVDIVAGGFDLAIRIANKLDDSGLIAKKLAVGSRILCASPSYLRAHGTPRQPAELASHACLRYAHNATPDGWELAREGHPSARVQVRGPLQINNSLALKAAALGGLGILLTPDFVVSEELRARTLRHVLKDWSAASYTIYAVAPPARYTTPKARAFTTFMEKALAR